MPDDFESRWFAAARNWTPGDSWTSLETLDVQTAGEPLRIVISGYPEIAGRSILERRRFLVENLDAYRRILMWEPRGHADMYGAILGFPRIEEFGFRSSIHAQRRL